AEGCSIHLVARDPAMLEKAAAGIRDDFGVSATAHALDLSRSESVASLMAAIETPDILVNNAGAIPGGDLQAIDEARWRAAWDLKVFGYIDMCREFFRLMKARGSGVIVNILGNGGERVDAGYIAGAAGNAALMAFTRALGGNSAEVGVRVVGVNPGPVATDRLVGLMRKEAATRFGDPERWTELARGFPFGRAATVEEIAATVVLLASDLSSYTTGTIVTIDGGMVNRGSLI
ncbi:MAG: SDR family oxidoreductase, partial [Burkholderiales bacterium]